MNDMKNIKDLLSDFEVAYDHNDWIKLEKDLPKSPGMSGLTKTILVATAVILSVASIYIITQITNNDSQRNPVVVDNQKPDKVDINSTVITSESELITNDIHVTSKNDELIVDDSKLNNSTSDQVSNNSTTDVSKTVVLPIKDKTESKTNNISSNEGSTVALPDLSNAKFYVQIYENCIPSKVIFSAENIPADCEVIWNTDENYRVYGKNTEHSYLEEGTYMPEVLVIFNNNVLKSQKLPQISINKPSMVKINFDNTENLYYFTCNNVEDLRLLWSIDNQQFSEKEISYDFSRAGEYLINLTAINEFGCKSEASEKVNIVIEHVYFVPNAFVPTANGVNSSFGPIGENMDFVSYKLIIVDGNGNTVFDSDSPDYMWNGRIDNIGEEARPGFYLWEIKTLDQFGNVQTKKGRVNLMRN
jgi:hypothetical protein